MIQDWLAVLLAVLAIITSIGVTLWAHDGDPRCLVAECRIEKR